MADDQDKSQKTEDPTEKKLLDAREKGQVPTSREVNHLFMIAAVTLIIMTIAPAIMSNLSNVLKKFIAAPHLFPMDEAHIGETLTTVSAQALQVMILPLVILIVAALLAGLVQTGVLFAPDRIVPKLEKISPMKGFGRLFSSQSVTEFTKGILKLAVVGAISTLVMLPELDSIEQTITMPLGDLLLKIHWLIIRLLIAVVSIVAFIAAMDFLYVKFKHTRDQRMSRQDIKDEMKQSEGDPQIRQRLRQIRHERAQSRMMSAVPEATVVVTNPTHYSVALKYELHDMAAPIVVAKGADHIAMKIREVARENNVPIVENKAVARALFASVEIDQEVPIEHFKAVAEVISYVMRLKGQL
jgi:flagellar biosynthesis protein FlhB